MPKTVFQRLCLIGLLSLCPLAAEAQSPPLNFNGAMSSVVATPANTFLSALAANNGRQNCEIQYVGTLQAGTVTSGTNSFSSIGFVYFGSAASAATAKSFALPLLGTITCETVNGGVEGNAISVAATTANGVFIVKTK